MFGSVPQTYLPPWCTPAVILTALLLFKAILFKQGDASAWRQKVKQQIFKKNQFHSLDLKTVWNQVLSHLVFYLYVLILYLATSDSTIWDTSESHIARTITSLEMEGWWLTKSCKELCFLCFWDTALSRNGDSQQLALIKSSNKCQNDPGVSNLYLPIVILASCCI